MKDLLNHMMEGPKKISLINLRNDFFENYLINYFYSKFLNKNNFIIAL